MHLALQDAILPARLRFNEPMTDEELFQFCHDNETLRIERDSNGELILMSPAGLEGSSWNSEIIADLTIWARKSSSGKVFDSNGGFTLPDGSMRSPDAAFISWGRWNTIPRSQQKVFGKVVPEFVIELRSESDVLSELQDKMQMWITNGVELAWMIDPKRKVIEVYRASEETEVHENPASVLGTAPVSGFELVMTRVWD